MFPDHTFWPFGIGQRNVRNEETGTRRYDSIDRTLPKESEDPKEWVGVLQGVLEERDKQIRDETRRREEAESDFNRLRVDKEKEVNDLRRILSEQDRRIKEHDAQCAILQRQIEDQGGLLEARTAELQVAQAFLAKTNTISIAEVKSMINDLNADIFQTAARVAEVVNFANRSEHGLVEGRVVEKDVQRWLGSDLTLALRTTDDPTILQAAIQGVICRRCHLIVCSWPDHVQEQRVHAYPGVYQCVKECLPQAVAGRWRSLTRQNLRLWSGETSHNAEHEYWISSTLHGTLDICKATGAISDNGFADSLSQSTYGDLTSIIHLAMRLRDVIGEEVTSCDLEPILRSAGEPFDQQDMEEDGGDKGSQLYAGGARILCTVELGLMRNEKIETKDGRARFKQTVIVKPKVALTSILEAPQPQKSSKRGKHTNVVPSRPRMEGRPQYDMVRGTQSDRQQGN